MTAGVGEALVGEANRRGLLLFVGLDGVVKYYPSSRMTPKLLRLLVPHQEAIKAWILLHTVSGGGDDAST